MNKLCYFVFGVKLPLLIQYIALGVIFFRPITNLVRNKYFRIFLLILLPTIIFVRILRNDPFFLSDDFAHLTLVSTTSYSQILAIVLSPAGIWVHHRIFVAFWLFKAIYDAFGTNIYAYLSVIYLFQILNSILFYRLLLKVRIRPGVALAIGIVFSAFYLWWISNLHDLLAVTFLILATSSWFNFLEKYRNFDYWLAILFYSIAIFTKEITFLLVPILFLFTPSYNFLVQKVKIRKVVYAAIPFLIIFVAFALFYASGFLAYAKLPSGAGYKIGFSISLLIHNLVRYFSFMVPILYSKTESFVAFVLLFIGFDLFKRRPLVTPYLLSAAMLIIPPCLFEARFSGYYSYYSSVFLLIGLAIILSDLAKIYAKSYFAKKLFLTRIIKTSAVVFLFFAVFGLRQVLLDNCFLIQYPWQKSYKTAFYSLLNRIESRLQGGITDKIILYLNKKEQAPEIISILETHDFNAFLKPGERKTYLLTLDENDQALTVEKVKPKEGQ